MFIEPFKSFIFVRYFKNMNVYYSLEELPAFRDTVITIGSYDGVHVAHEKILNKIIETASEKSLESVVITFHPHPRLIVQPKENGIKLLSTRTEKIALFDKYQLNALVFVPFTIDFSQLSAEEYILNFLVRYFRPKFIIIGYDHRFGKDRSGDINLLRHFAPRAGFEVIEIEKQVVDDISISSTKIRKALSLKDMQTAEKLLGHPYSIIGKVVKGRQLGRELGYPTANVQTDEKEKLIPPAGIYSVWVFVSGLKYGGMLYIGDRPTVEELGVQSIEVNIFSFSEDIYGKSIKLDIVDFIRDDQKFESLSELKQALAKDKIIALKQLNFTA